MPETGGLGPLPEAALAAVVELAELRPAGRLFYCSATSAFEPVRTEGHRVSTHVSTAMELAFVRQGSMGVAAPGQLFRLVPGQLLVIDVGVEHGEVRDEEQEVVYFALQGTNVQFDQRGPGRPWETLSVIGRTDLTWIVDCLRQELSTKDRGFERAVHALLEYLACIFSRRIERGNHLDVSLARMQEHIDDRAWQAMRMVLGHLAAHFGEDIDLEALSRSLGYSSSHLNRFFRRHLGKTMSKCLRDLRIAHGRGLLIRTDMTLSEISQLSGYSDPASFRRAFELVTGMKLREYRRGTGGWQSQVWPDVPPWGDRPAIERFARE